MCASDKIRFLMGYFMTYSGVFVILRAIGDPVPSTWLTYAHAAESMAHDQHQQLEEALMDKETTVTASVLDCTVSEGHATDQCSDHQSVNIRALQSFHHPCALYGWPAMQPTRHRQATKLKHGRGRRSEGGILRTKIEKRGFGSPSSITVHGKVYRPESNPLKI